MPNFVLSKDCKAYINSTAAVSTDYTTALSGATEVSNIKDLSLNFSTAKADISTRAGNGWVQSAPTLKDGTITFQMVWKPSDPAFDDLLTAWLGNDEVFFAALDGADDAVGSQGPAGNFAVTNFSRNEALPEAVMVDVELSASSYNDWHVSGT
jgi:hypothetical protein